MRTIWQKHLIWRLLQIPWVGDRCHCLLRQQRRATIVPPGQFLLLLSNFLVMFMVWRTQQPWLGSMFAPLLHQCFELPWPQHRTLTIIAIISRILKQHNPQKLLSYTSSSKRCQRATGNEFTQKTSFSLSLILFFDLVVALIHMNDMYSRTHVGVDLLRGQLADNINTSFKLLWHHPDAIFCCIIKV